MIHFEGLDNKVTNQDDVISSQMKKTPKNLRDLRKMSNFAPMKSSKIGRDFRKSLFMRRYASSFAKYFRKL